MTAFVPALLVKVTLILAGGLVLMAFMRGVSSAVRHLVLLAALVCGLTLPLMMSIAPRWDVGILQPSKVETPAASRSLDENALPATPDRRVEHPLPPATFSNTGNGLAPRSWISFSKLVAPIAPALLWMLGVVAVLGWLAIGRIRLRKIVREAWPLTSHDWQRTLEAVRLEAGVARSVGLFTSSVVSTPLTWGTRAPVILLPEDALDWSEDHRRVVLRHEIAHVSRGDALTQLVAGCVCAIYWFHPLAWITERKLRAECERACDDRVVSLGTPATDYAVHLLEVARSARAFGAPGFLSVAMARPTQLEGRLLAVLNESRQRVAASRAERLAAVAISVLVMLPLAAFRPVERSAKPIAYESAAASVASPAPSKLAKAPEVAKRDLPAEEQSYGDRTYDARKKFDSTFQLSVPARSGGTLYIDLKTGGGITITPWDRAEVSVKARLGGRNWRETRVTLEPSSGGARLASEFVVSFGNTSSSHDFDIKVPREFNVQLHSSGGSLSIAGVNGSFSGETGGGEITLSNVNGRADLSTGGGEVLVENSNLDGSVNTGGGLVRIKGVNGRFSGSSGSGPVIRTDSNGDEEGYGVGAGYGKGASASASASGSRSAYATSGRSPLIMSSAGGAISLPSAPNGAHVTTGGGKITIGSAGGAVYAQTGGGDVRIGPTAGSVKAITGAGDVDVDFVGKGSVDISTGTGRVTITAPSDLNANLELITAYTDKFRGKTRIISDWPVSVTETKEWDTSMGTPRRYVIVRQQIGNGGPLIRVNTVNGDIVLRKGD